MSEKDALSSQFKDPAAGLSPEDMTARYGSDRAERHADKARMGLAAAAAFDGKKSDEESQPVRALTREHDLSLYLPRREKGRGYER